MIKMHLSLKLKNATLEFKNISFTYPDGTHALKNLSAKIEGGKKVGLVGISGFWQNYIFKI
jgi:ABC-type multidrug transport system fused ATPase/permease subunit